jgi:hypothetical protein
MTAGSRKAFTTREPGDLQLLLDERAILACLRRIARGIDRFDQELFLSGFHPDAVIEAGVIVTDPKSSFEAGRKMHDQAQQSTLHYLANHTSDIDGNLAHSETYFFFVGHNRDDSNIATGGRYVDRLERRNSGWKVAFRHTVLEWTSIMPSQTIPLFDDAPDLHLNGLSSRDDADPSYRRPLVNRRTLSTQMDPGSLSTPRR